MHKLVWLSSYPKSGNTWVRLFLAAYTKPERPGVDINNIDMSLHAGNRDMVDRVIGVQSSDLTAAEIERYRPEVYRQLAAEADEPLFIKVHDRWRQHAEGSAIFPADATLATIYIVRDPRAVAPSYANHYGLSVDAAIERMSDPGNDIHPQTDRLRRQLHQPMGSWSQHVLSWLDQTELPVLLLRYEDMHADPESSFAKIVAASGLTLDSARLSKALAETRFDRLQQQESEAGFKERPRASTRFFRRGEAESWREELTTAQCERIESTHGPVMQRLGYL